MSGLQQLKFCPFLFYRELKPVSVKYDPTSLTHNKKVL